MLCTLTSSAATAQTPDPMVRYFTRTTDLVGNPISSVIVGEQFRLDVIVQDIRDPDFTPFPGVFAGTTRVVYDDSLTPVTLPPDFEIDSFFPIVQLFEIEPDAILGSGASVSLGNPGFAPQRLFSVVLEATSPGEQVFLPTFYETQEFLTLLYGGNGDVIGIENILYQSSTLSVLVPEPGTWVGMLSGAIALGV